MPPGLLFGRICCVPHFFRRDLFEEYLEFAVIRIALEIDFPAEKVLLCSAFSAILRSQEGFFEEARLADFRCVFLTGGVNSTTDSASSAC